MAATGPDLERLRRGLGLADERGERLYLSRIYQSAQGAPRCCLVGPFMGAPQAAMLMETLSAWGGAQFLFFGWCGAIHPDVHTGDILLPTAALVDEGTSRGYGVTDGRVHLPGPEPHDTLKALLGRQGLAFREGTVWSTDAVFRETPAKVRAYRRQGALAVEMELSACLTVARQRGVGMAAVLVVSDELSAMHWRPGFSDPRFKQACRAVTRSIEALWQTR